MHGQVKCHNRIGKAETKVPKEEEINKHWTLTGLVRKKSGEKAKRLIERINKK